MKKVKIIVNGKKIYGHQKIAYDGCHKIYITKSVKEEKEMQGFGYEIIEDITKLPKVFKKSCPLRFISSADLKTSYVCQGETATFDTIIKESAGK